MKQILLLIFIFFIGFTAFAQFESNTKFKPIPPANMGIKTNKTVPKAPEETPSFAPEVPSIKAPNVYDSKSIISNQKPSNSKYKIGEEKNNFTMSVENDFANPGDKYVPKMENDLDKALRSEGLKGERGILVKRNIDFGEIKTKSKFFIVKLRDFGAIDGDLVKVSSNSRVLVAQLFLESNFREIKINLDNGFNKLDFEALNIGTLGGNTAEIRIYDDQNTLMTNDYWDNLAAGFKATIMVIKEE
ncbi:hypothetical protein [Flavobacterium agrisoli]|uniref:Secreted protein n=1 Tax=Flavobacterium agrisoli TaxID=2793066 RepID=A0A934PJA3_9FLAO|nr:hypothetical protein [Flavobacterium agrisoli]MBK0369161.1 hypothetical protein [Flavobacterium agrisoli]